MTRLEPEKSSKCSNVGLTVVTAETKNKVRSHASCTTAFESLYRLRDFLRVGGNKQG